MKENLSLGAKLKNVWEYKRTALLWTVLIVLVCLLMTSLFMQFSHAYFSSDAFAGIFLDHESVVGAVTVLLDDYVLMSLLLLLYAFCAFAFLSSLWTDDYADYYILLLLWSLTFYFFYGVNLFNPGGGALHYLVRSLADTLYQLSTIPLLLCLYIRTERYRTFVRYVLILEYLLCALFALLSVTGVLPTVLRYVEFVSDLLFCGALTGIMILGNKERKQGNDFYRLFCPMMSVLLIVIAVFTAIALIGSGDGFYLQQKAVEEIIHNLNLHPFREHYLQRYLLFVLLIILFIRILTELMHNKSIIRVLKYEKESAQGYAAAVRERIDEVRRVKHDTMLHINVCNMLYTQGEYQRLGEYLEKLQTDGQAIAPLQYSNNLMIDYLVMSFSRRAEKNQISLQTDIEILPELSISDSDLCSLLNNVLQNALEACLKLPDVSKRWIRLEIRADENKVYFTCVNSCNGYFIRNNGRYLTTKKSDSSSHGYGMGIIRDLCRQNGGAMAAQVDGMSFTIKVALPYHSENHERGTTNDFKEEN
jgi:signal transduction histidine kinase